MQRRV
jgi:bifunctional non-homologous end joining protein LigD